MLAGELTLRHYFLVQQLQKAIIHPICMQVITEGCRNAANISPVITAGNGNNNHNQTLGPL